MIMMVGDRSLHDRPHLDGSDPRPPGFGQSRRRIVDPAEAHEEEEEAKTEARCR